MLTHSPLTLFVARPVLYALAPAKILLRAPPGRRGRVDLLLELRLLAHAGVPRLVPWKKNQEQLMELEKLIEKLLVDHEGNVAG